MCCSIDDDDCDDDDTDNDDSNDDYCNSYNYWATMTMTTASTTTQR